MLILLKNLIKYYGNFYKNKNKLKNNKENDRTFISYSRSDGCEFAKMLREQLEGEDLSVWQDLVALRGGEDWWSQIEDALKSKHLRHFVLVVTPGSLASPVVRQV